MADYRNPLRKDLLTLPSIWHKRPEAWGRWQAMYQNIPDSIDELVY